MWLVLCSEQDLAALWAWRELRALGLQPIELVTAGMLSTALRWSHEVGQGAARFEVTLGDGRLISSRNIVGTLNRLRHVPLNKGIVGNRDAAYAEQEWNAFLLSALHCLPDPMLNRPAPFGLCGAHRHSAEWTRLAAGAGLPVARIAINSAVPSPAPLTCSNTFVVGDTVLGLPAANSQIAGGCRRLAAASDCNLLGIHFNLEGGAWQFEGATPFPDLFAGGVPLLAALARALRKAP